jgi:hypothetical protein
MAKSSGSSSRRSRTACPAPVSGGIASEDAISPAFQDRRHAEPPDWKVVDQKVGASELGLLRRDLLLRKAVKRRYPDTKTRNALVAKLHEHGFIGAGRSGSSTLTNSKQIQKQDYAYYKLLTCPP